MRFAKTGIFINILVMEQFSRSVTIILPCAGDGKRLGLAIPKELYEIQPGIKLIDFSLDHIRYAFRTNTTIPRDSFKVCVVIRPEKKKVFDYVKKTLNNIEVISVFFNDDYYEWPGSVYSAWEHMSDFNVVMLPDSRIVMSRDDVHRDGRERDLLTCMMDVLRSYQVAFGVIGCTDNKVLQRFGALVVDSQDRVQALMDKPDAPVDSFNAFWGCYGFVKRAAHEVYRWLVASVRHQPVPIHELSFFPVGSFRIFGYQDLGTWDEIEIFKNETTERS